MTALVSLATRLSLAKVALHVSAEKAVSADLEPLISAGVDLLVLGGSGTVEQDVATLQDLRRRYARTRLLLGTDSDDVAVPGAADVVHYNRRHWLRGHVKGHEWGLRGFTTAHGAAIASPGDDFDYMFVGPLADNQGDLLASAVAHQPPLTATALPWFAMVDAGMDAVTGFLTAGARRVALSGDVWLEEDPCREVDRIAEAVAAAWSGDVRTPGYRREAFGR